MNEICLVVIYNHNFERNIEVVKRIYAGRFSHVYQIMPFYRGSDPSVIGVYECSYQFNGYIAQAASRIRDAKYSHYVFVADDMVLNPAINERNICEWLKLSPDVAFHPAFTLMSPFWCAGWSWGPSAIANLLSRSNACEWQNALPSITEARKRFEHHSLNWRQVASERRATQMLSRFKLDPKNPYLLQSTHSQEELKELSEIKEESESLYPMVRGFSDFFSIPACNFDEFAHCCGVFAAMRMFVEVAIPTSLVLCTRKINNLTTCGLNAEKGVTNYRIREQIEQKYDLSFARLLREYPKDYLFIHPIKLSRWKDLP